MKWQQLVQAAAIYDRETDYDRFYHAYLQDRDDRAWWDPAGPSDDQVKRLFLFVNQWRSRVHSRKPEDVKRLRDAAVTALPVLERLRRRNIVEIDFAAEENRADVAEAFASFYNGMKGGRSTGAPKALHWYNRSLFVMWDQAIRAGYAVDTTPESYAEIFLPRMQKEAREAVESFIADGRAAPGEAMEMIESQCSGTPLAKLVDQHNYCKFTLRAEELWQ